MEDSCNYNYRYLFFKYLYKYLGLDKLDMDLFNNNIKMVDEENKDKRISKYFAFKNIGNTDSFNDELKEEYNSIFSTNITDLLNNNKAIEFILKTYKDFFHLNTNQDSYYYGPVNSDFLAPADCIVLGLNYQKYAVPDDQFEEEISKQNQYIDKIVSYITETLSKEKNIKLFVIPYNEFVLSQVKTTR